MKCILRKKDLVVNGDIVFNSTNILTIFKLFVKVTETQGINGLNEVPFDSEILHVFSRVAGSARDSLTHFPIAS